MPTLLLLLAMLSGAPPASGGPGPQAALKVPDAQQFVGNPKGAPLTGEPLHRRTLEVSALLRCPVCQGLSVADSPSEMAVNMKVQVRELLARGYTEAQILQYFELSYGGFVLLRPKNPAVWMIPIVALLLGMAIVARKIHKLAALPPPAANQQKTTDEDLERVRKLVSGVKPGVKS